MTLLGQGHAHHATMSGMEQYFLTQLSRANSWALDSAIRLATGKKVNKPADDPAAFLMISSFEQRLSAVKGAETQVEAAASVGAETQLTLDEIRTQLAAVSSTNAAKLFGLYPRKGTIAVGADADLVVWDPHATRTVDGKSMHSRSDFSPYDGWEVTGWPRWTISRGEVVAEAGEVTAEPGRGRLAPRGPHRSI